MSVSSNSLFADNHDTEQNIIDQAKEINKEVKKKQAETQANINSEQNVQTSKSPNLCLPKISK